MISIIIPVHNSEKDLHRCLGSILSQTIDEWEVILVNDGSTDNSGYICQQYAQLDQRIKVHHQPNKGVSAARNAGLDYSKGDWITFCDSDDEFSNNRSLESYKENFEEDVDVIRAGFERVKKGKQYIISTTSLKTSDKGRVYLKCNNSCYEAYLWNTCFRKSALKSIRFDEKISWCEDHLFTFEAIKNARFVKFIPDIVYRYFAPNKDDSESKKHLSTKFIEPFMIVDGARKERVIKLSLLSHDDREGHELIKSEYQYKIRLAIRYAIEKSQYLKATSIAIQNGFFAIQSLISAILHTKIVKLFR